jgi:hypothetical protein
MRGHKTDGESGPKGTTITLQVQDQAVGSASDKASRDSNPSYLITDGQRRALKNKRRLRSA